MISNLAKYGKWGESELLKILNQLSLNENLRAEDLSVENWGDLYQAIVKSEI